MEEILNRLIDAELKAETMVKQAEKECENIVHQAVLKARLNEKRFEAKIPELHRSILEEGKKQAEQTIAELKRLHQDQRQALTRSARDREQKAIETAFALLLEPEL